MEDNKNPFIMDLHLVPDKMPFDLFFKAFDRKVIIYDSNKGKLSGIYESGYLLVDINECYNG